MLREGLAARPDLWHAWVAVVRQLAAVNRLDEALALCEQTVQRFPLLPRVHVERAEIMRLLGDRQGEQASLREALRLSPGWAQACCRLADSLEAGGDLAGSRSALESAVRHAPSESYLHGYLADVLWRQAERARALEHLTRALRLDPGYEWAWTMLRLRGQEQGEPDRALTLAREIVASRPADVRGWLGLAAVAAEEDERMQALQRAVRLAPLSVRAHSRRVQALMDARRFDEALAALSDTAWGEALPVELRAHRARIEAARGDLPAALATMRQVLADDPQYLDGWAAAADWYFELGDTASYLATAEQMHRLAPNDAYALGYLAHANRQSRTGVDVRPWLRRAVHLKPDHTWAAGELFDRELEAGDLDAAEAALGLLQAQPASASTLGREVELAARREDKRTALQRYRELLRITGDDRDAIRTGARALRAAGWRSDLKEALDIAVHDAATHPAAGAVWVTISLELSGKGFVPAREVLENGALGRAAAEAYLDHVARTRDTAGLRGLLRRMRTWLAADTWTWGTVGYALLECGLSDQTCRWLADWRGRTDAKPWMLLNAACALRDHDRDEEAAEIGRHALSLPPDHARASHQLWLAADAALAGRRDEALRSIADVRLDDGDTYYHCLEQLVQALLHLGDPARSATRERYRQALACISRARSTQPTISSYPALRRLLERTLWRACLTRTGSAVLALPLFVWVCLSRLKLY
jgi:tetratricopeptide (TPR) repeat protein